MKIRGFVVLFIPLLDFTQHSGIPAFLLSIVSVRQGVNMRIPPVRVVFPEQDRQEILRRVERCLATGQVAQGENVREFEDTFARYVGVKHAVAVSSGGTAIEMAMRLLNVK